MARNQQKEKEEEDRMSLSYSVVIPGGCDSLLSIKIQEKNRFKKKRKKKQIQVQFVEKPTISNALKARCVRGKIVFAIKCDKLMRFRHKMGSDKKQHTFKRTKKRMGRKIDFF